MKLAVAAVLLLTTTTVLADPPIITGLWAARRNFGPSVRGTLEIYREGNHWLASIGGRTSP